MESAQNNNNLDNSREEKKPISSKLTTIGIGVVALIILLLLLYISLGKDLLGQRPDKEPDQTTEELPHTGSLEEGGTIEGTLDMAGNNIVNVGLAEEDTDAISRGGADDRFVNVTGDTMTGDLTINNEKDLLLDSSADLLLGDTYLNEYTSSTDSGASLVGTFDEFDNSNSTNVQDVLDDFDLAIGNILTETDPVFSASPAAGISNTYISNWNTAFSWGDHSAAGYFTSESDPVWIAARPNYFNLGENETVTGRPAFNGGASGSTSPFSVDSNYLVSNLNSDLLDSMSSSSFLRSNASDAFESGNTLTFAGNADFNGDLTVSDQTIVFDTATFSAFDLTGDLRILASGDNDDYIYINTASNIPYLFFEQGGADDAGFRVNGTDLEYRNEGGSWTTLNSLAGVPLWTDIGSELTPAGSESIQLGDTDWIGIGSAAERIIFDDSNGDISIMGASVGIGTTDPGSYTLNVEGGSNHGIYALTSGASAYALRGDSTGTGGFGIYGSNNSNTGYAVYGTNSNSGYGVYGASDGYAIYGSSSSGTAGYFNSTSGYGLLVESGSVGIGTTSPADFTLQVNGSIGPDSAPNISSSSRTTSDIDTTNEVGQYSSIAIGTDGLPIISHYDFTNDSLRACKCSNTPCTSATCSTIDSPDAGYTTSIAIGTDELPIISHYDNSGRDLKVCHCNNTSCTSAACSTIDIANDVGVDSSIAIGIDGLPIISHRDNTTFDLRVCHCNDTSCTSAACATIDSTNNVGYTTSIAIGTEGLPVISHRDNNNGDLRACHCNNTSCTSATCTTIDSTNSVGNDSSIAIGTDGLPVISHGDATDDDLRVCKCSNASCTSATCTSIDTANLVGDYTSIAMGTDGLPIISHQDITNHDLRVCKCSNASCTSAACSTVDSSGTFFYGKDSSIAIGADGLPIISHYFEDFDDLRVVKCATEDCANTSGSYYDGGSDLGSRGKYFNNVYGVNYWAKEGMAISNFDLAEDYLAIDQSTTAGDVVALAHGSDISIDKTRYPYQSNVIGVVSTEPGLHLTEWTLSQEERKLMRPVALAGRVPVKITTENGSVKKGDFLVPSSKPGYAMKACGSKYCQPGTVIGRALEDFEPNHLGDTQQVTQELQESKEEVVNQLSVISSQLSEGSKLTTDNYKLKTEIEEQVKTLTKPIDSHYGEGRIMMFINLGWFSPPSPITELDQSTGYDFNTPSSLWSGNLDTIDNSQFMSSLSTEERVFEHIKVDSMTVGNLNITGLLTAREIQAGVLQAFEGENIIIKLSNTLEKTAFTIENSLGETVFKIDSIGKISIIENTQSPSVGKGVIEAGETSVQINTSSITSNSKIFTNPTAATNTQPAVVEKAENKYFIVSIKRPLTYDLTFDWWLIN